jgi:hypothetical protein
MSAMFRRLCRKEYRDDFVLFATQFEDLINFRPTEKQLIFVETYLKTGKLATAYETAGYADISKRPDSRKLYAYNRVMTAVNVQTLFRIVFFNWKVKNGITRQVMADKLLEIIDQADTLTVKLEAIKELNNIAGHHTLRHHRSQSRRVARQKTLETTAA